MKDGPAALKDRPVPTKVPEVVIREARRRQHRRWAVLGIVLLALAVAAGITVGTAGLSSRRSVAKGKNPPAGKRPAPGPASPAVEPVEPGPLAAGPNDTLYVADESHDQILASLPSGRFGFPSGRFRVVAGNGKVGFSGDGGPAVDAELDRPEGMAVSPNGTIYFADMGNNRIRAISPDGIITTIAGNGQDLAQNPGFGATPMTGVPATQVPIEQPTAVTIGPGGSVYIASENDVLAVEPDGDLALVDDGLMFDASDPGVMFQEQCFPASLAFDASANNLYIGCSSPWVILVRTSDGSLHYLGVDRPHDAWAAMAPAPGGGVFATFGSEIVAYGSGPAIGRAAYNFNLYRLPKGGSFWPQGIAALPIGLYADSDGVSGIGPPAIVMGGPPGPVTVLWSHTERNGSPR